MKKRTKIETVEQTERTPTGHPRFVSIIREVYVDSGRVKRIRVKLDAPDRESLQAQWTGAMAAILEARKSEQRQEPKRLMDWPAKQFKFWNLQQITKRDLAAFVSEMSGASLTHTRKQDKSWLIEKAIELVSCGECGERVEPSEVTEAGTCASCAEQIQRKHDLELQLETV